MEKRMDTSQSAQTAQQTPPAGSAGRKVETAKSIGGFGGRGWSVILYCVLMFWFYAGMVNDGSNITAPAVAEKIGVAYPLVLSMGTVAGIVAFVLFIIFGQVNSRLGVRTTSSLCLVIAGVAYICVGQATSLVAYAIALCVLAGAVMSAGYICGGVFVANWFPKKKGIVMGYTTMGLNFASAFYVPLIAAVVGAWGISRGVLVPAIACIVVGVVGFIFMRGNPMEYGKYPDNVSREEYEAEYCTEKLDASGGWSVKRLLKTRELWLCAVSTGILQLITSGIVTQLVVRNVHLGFTQERAIGMMTIVAIVGIFGSWAFGVLDQKLGTKKAMVIFALWEIVALLANITETTAGIYISIVMIGMSIGGSANFTVSLPANVFGRHGFSKVNGVIFPIQGLITAMAFVINAVSLALTGELRMSYVVFAGLVVVSMVLAALVKEHKYNRDFHVEEEHMKHITG